MPRKEIIAICQSGGEFQTESDGSLSYKGGEAHAMEIHEQLKFNDMRMEIADMFDFSFSTMTIKYFLPGNRKTLISISNDKDLQRMIKFHGDATTTDIYVMAEGDDPPDVSNMPASISSRTTLSEAILVDAAAPPPPCVLDDVVDETSQPSLLDDAFDIVNDVVVDGHIDIPPYEMSLTPSFSGPAINEKNSKAVQLWQNTITGVGQRFNSVNEFREALRKYAIAHHFAFRYTKNDIHRVTVKCKAEGCPWRIHASRLTTAAKLICIKKMNPKHTCEGSALTTGHPATRSWVASMIMEKMKVFPDYKPKDIVRDIKQEYGIELNYFQAWRGKEIAKEQLQGSYKEAYGQLPYFCERIMETNPGSLATFTTNEDSSFHRLFVSFHASLFGFQQGCRPLLFLDSVPIKSKYQGTLLSATSTDGNDGVFPVAFAVVDTETDDNWHWFLSQLKDALSTCQGLTFVADRDKGLKASIADVFANDSVFHAYCMRYLSEKLLRDLKGPFSHEVKRLLVEDFYAAAYAPSPEVFQTCSDSIKAISFEAYRWVMQSEPLHWSNAFFKGARYNYMTSDFGKVFYSWASDAHELPITQMVEAIRVKIMELTCTRRVDSDQWRTRLTPCMEEKLEKESLKVLPLQVLLSGGNTFEVRGDSTEVVDIDHCVCSCKDWQLNGLPCCHAIAVINCMGRDPYDYCPRFFTTDSYRLTYSESVHPIPNEDGPKQKDVSRNVTVTPPPTRRPPGRPSTKKLGSQESLKRQLQCGRCKATGHNKSSCKESQLALLER